MKTATRLRSTFMRLVASEAHRDYCRRRARLVRRIRGRAPVVHYFHELEDPYSHLAVQRLEALRERYTVDFRVHLTSPAGADYRGDASRYPDWAMTDAASIAPGYGVRFPPHARWPQAEAIRSAAGGLQPLLDASEFVERAIEIGDALWRGQARRDTEVSQDVFDAGNALRSRLGHYAGAMFWFDGEWYWGLDRLEDLESRLIEEGYGAGPFLVPRPECKASAGSGDGLRLEMFPSLRSPYTAICFDRAMELVDRTGVALSLRPVMPMMMRGVPAPGTKGRYIMFDAAREARRYDVPFGRIVDPFGAPVRLAYSLYPFAVEQGLEREFISRYLRAAWAEGIDITGPAGLKRVIEEIGLSWRDAGPRLGEPGAGELLERNVADMLAAGLWGVPSFRLSGGNAPPFVCWGQDRLWRLEQEIASRAASSTAGSEP